MTFLQVILLAVVALFIGQLPKGRGLALLALCSFVIFWLQPYEPAQPLLFWLPTATLALTVILWSLTSTPESSGWRQNWPAVAVMAGVVLLMDLNHYFKLTQIYTDVTPNLRWTLVALALTGGLVILFLLWRRASSFWRVTAFLAIILVFILLKSPQLSHTAVALLAQADPGLTVDRTVPLAWLGFSYTAFRLLHTLRERQNGRLPSVTLSEYVDYVLFFPSFTAGPIDRLDRFNRELRTPLALENQDWIFVGTRLFAGLFKKFVLADTLAIISISDVLVEHVKSTGWLWLFLYAYAFRIYFDFSGYTDIAIGMGRLMGIRLPENFAAPYLKSNLTQFWNSWHMTLTQWFRTYFFNPVTRALRSSSWSLPVWLIILITQVSTMLLIGFWHGISAGFIAWGLWHGIGLFLQNRWSEFIRGRLPAWLQTAQAQRIMNYAGVFLTFNFVALGWLFFELSSPAVAWQALRALFGQA